MNSCTGCGSFINNYIEYADHTKRFFTFDYLFQKVNNICERKETEIIDKIAGWKIKPDNENMLFSLIKNDMDAVACKYSDFYIADINIEVFLFAIKNENEVFIKHVLQDSMVSPKMLTDARIVETLLKSVENGRIMELAFNILIYSDFSQWRQPEVKRLLDVIDRLVKESDESNNILLTSNTLMVLAHSSEILYKIIKNVRVFRRYSHQMLEAIGRLAEKIVSNTSEELIHKVFLDRDFKDRTLLKIVTKYKLSNFVSSTKVIALLDDIWEGQNANECDGGIRDFSVLTHLATSNVIYIPGK